MIPVGLVASRVDGLPEWGKNIPMYHGRTDEKRKPFHARPNRGRRGQQRGTK